MMKLTAKEVKIDLNIFAPVVRVTIELPLEIMRAGVAPNWRI